MEIKQIEYFYYICKSGSFTHAAKQLYMSQQGLSKAISKLEDELHVKLFDRKPNSIHLTEAGNIFYKQCNVILSSVEASIRQIESLSDSKYSRIYIGFEKGSFEFVPEDLFYDYIHMTSKTYYFDLKELTSDECFERVEDGRLTMAIVMNPTRNDSIEFTPLCQAGLYAYLPGENEFESEFLDVSSLAGKRIAFQNDYRSYYESFNKKCQENGFVPEIIMKLPHRAAFERCCEEWMIPGVSYYTDYMYMEHPHKECLHKLDLDCNPMEVVLITKKKRMYSQMETELQQDIISSYI